MMLLPWVGSNEGFAYAERGEVFERSRHFVAQRCGVGERRRHHIVKCKDRITQGAGCGGCPGCSAHEVPLWVSVGRRRPRVGPALPKATARGRLEGDKPAV